jgi:putative methionine-R-sulfoxide reductase with GAF domain
MSPKIKKYQEPLPFLLQSNYKLFLTNLNFLNVYEAISEIFFDFLEETVICIICTVDSGQNDLKIVWKKGISLVTDSHLKVGEGVSGKAAQDGQLKLINDGLCNYDYINEETAAYKNIQTQISIPLLNANRPSDVVNLYLSTKLVLNKDVEKTLQILAMQSAYVLHQVNQQLNENYALYDVVQIEDFAKELSNILDFDLLLKKVLQVAKDICRADIVSIWYQNFTTQKWERNYLGNLKDSTAKLPDIQAGEGIIGHVLQTQKPFLSNDVSVTPFYFSAWRTTKSELAIPLLLANEVKGILNIESSRINAFSVRHEKMLSLLGTQVAITLRDAQLSRIAELRTRQVIVLKEIGEALSHQKSLDSVLKRIAKECYYQIGGGRKTVYIMLIDKRRKLLDVKVTYGNLTDRIPKDLQIPFSTRSIVTSVAQSGEEKVVDDITADPDYLKVIYSTRSEICVPILFRDEVIGVINVESAEISAFSGQDLELLRNFADQTALAIKIAELYEIRLKQLEALFQTGNKIRSGLNFYETLQTIATEGLNAIGPEKRILYIQIYNSVNKDLEVKCVEGSQNKNDYLGKKFSSDVGISGWVFKNQNSYLCSEVKSDENYFELNPDVRSEICIPILFQQQVIGLINVESLKENDFGQNEIEILEGLANQAGVALQNTRLNEELIHTQLELTQAWDSMILGEILSGLTHDIRSNTALISGEIQWMRRLLDKKELTVESLSEYLTTIDFCLAKIEEITSEFKKRIHKQAPEYIPINLGDLIRKVISLLSGKAQRHQIHFEFDYKDLNFKAEVDELKILRVFENILFNAIDAMPGGGPVQIVAKKYQDDFEIQFIDKGLGISVDNISRIWENFFTTKEKGTGLGLGICKRIIQMEHRGSIQIQSAEDVGTTVVIKLPYQQKK